MDKVRRIATIKQISAPDRHHRLSLAIIGFLVHLALVLQGASATSCRMLELPRAVLGRSFSRPRLSDGGEVNKQHCRECRLLLHIAQDHLDQGLSIGARKGGSQRRRYPAWQATHADVTSCSAAFTWRMASNVWSTEASCRAIASRLAARCILVPASCIGWGK